MKMILMMMMMTMAVIGEVVGEGTPTRVVLMSFDGFRYDYLDRPEASLPNMRALAENGVRSEIVPVFPAKRFPNEYTLVTGLYAEAHGIVSDSFYDEEHNDTFDMSRTESFWWEQGEPIWVTAERQNVTSAAYFWPGSEAEIRGYRPSIYTTYNASVPFEARIDTVVEWLADPEGPRMINLYATESPAAESRTFGPESSEVTAAIEMCDMVVGRLLAQLDERGLRDGVDVIITSNRGMSRVFPENQTIFLEDFDVDLESVDVIYPNEHGSPDSMLMLRPRFKEGSMDDERKQQEYDVNRRAMTALSGKHPNMSMYHKPKIWDDESGADNGEGGRIPKDFHYNDNDRIMPLIAVADTGFLLADRRDTTHMHDMLGMDGFEPKSREMHPFFLATGPSFKHGETFEAFPNVHIYSLLCELLGIKPALNSGKLRAVAKMLAPCVPSCGGDGGERTPAPESVKSGGSGRAAAGFIGFLIGVGGACIAAYILRKTGRLRFGASQPYVTVSDGRTLGADIEFSKL